MIEPPLPHLTLKENKPVTIKVLSLFVFSICLSLFLLTITGFILPSKAVVFALAATLSLLALATLVNRIKRAFHKPSRTALADVPTRQGDEQ